MMALLAHLKRSIPELKNPRYAGIFDDGRAVRLEYASQGLPTGKVPLHSYHAIYQSLFEKGWHSVTACDIRMAQDTAKEAKTCL